MLHYGAMNVYEIFAIAHPSLSQEEFLALVAEIEKKLENSGGKIMSRRVEEDQSLAYPIKGVLKGHIVHIDFQPSEGGLSQEVQQEMIHHEKLLRYLEFKKDLTPATVAQEGQQSILDRMRARQKQGEERHARPKVHAAPSSPEQHGTMDEKEVDKKIEELLK